MSQAVFFDSSADFRDWLNKNHATATELLAGFHKKASRNAGLTYSEALDEALCFGWIDGVRRSLGESGYTIRFSPRKPGSIWSTVNTKRAEGLIALGRMTPPGLQAFERRDPRKSEAYSYEVRSRGLDTDCEAKLQANAAAWEFFSAQPPWYRRAASWWVMSAKRDETRRKRLAVLIEDAANGRRIGTLARDKR